VPQVLPYLVPPIKPHVFAPVSFVPYRKIEPRKLAERLDIEPGLRNTSADKTNSEMTLTAYYDQNALGFLEATRDVDMSEVHGRFRAVLPDTGAFPARILDAGSGSGRDSLAFRQMGYAVEAFDASPSMVAATRDHAGVPTRQMRFEEFVWEHPFEGIWACASLLHVARVDLPSAVSRLVDHLSPGGALYLSFKLGEGERIRDGRRFTDMTPDNLRYLLDQSARLRQPDIWLSRDCRPERASEVWVNAVVQKG